MRLSLSPCFSTFVLLMKINFKKIDHVQLSITPGSVEQARHFYCGILGLKEIDRPKALEHIEGFWAEIANTRLHIAAEAEVCPTLRHPAFAIEHIQEVKAYLENKGVRIKEDLVLPGLARFSIFDPWGNRIELIEKTKA